MKTKNLFSKRIYLVKWTIGILVFVSTLNFANSQPTTFTWYNKHFGKINPISPEKNQRAPGPCTIFASVAAVEAMSSIYYNKDGSLLTLSESSVYNAGILYDCLGLACESGPGVGSALDFMKNTGVIDNQSYAFPDTGSICRTDCQDIFDFENYQYKVKIPGWEQLTSITGTLEQKETKLKKAIMDYGPIIVTLGGTLGNYYVSHYLYPGTSENRSHTVLILGWDDSDELNWHIKDSWYEYPYPDIWYVSTNLINVFGFSPEFYRIIPKISSDSISCVGTGCSTVFSSRPCVDQDRDGFYNWGMNPKPEFSLGIFNMDIDDGNPNIICRDGYNILAGPYISDTINSKYICSNGKTFTLQNFDPLAQKGFSVSWDLTPAYYFSSYHGNTKTAVVTPYSSYYGKKCKLEYSLYKGDTLVNKYKFDFYINGPREDLVSISTLDSYGGSPTIYGDTYYLCPNTNYTITYNNYDDSCSTSNFTWGLPYGWSKNWDYNHQVSINTNDNPDGFLSISALASYCNQNIQILEPYFGAADCGDYFILYPNPAESSVVIDVIKNKFLSEKISYDKECTLIVLDKAGISKNIVKFKGFPYTLDTSNLTEGLYFINLQLNGKRSTIQLAIKPK